MSVETPMTPPISPVGPRMGDIQVSRTTLPRSAIVVKVSPASARRLFSMTSGLSLYMS